MGGRASTAADELEAGGVVKARRVEHVFLVLCPLCEQRSLTFIQCPSCGALALRCDEDGSYFAVPSDLSRSPLPSESCRSCASVALVDFALADWASITRNGFRWLEKAQCFGKDEM